MKIELTFLPTGIVKNKISALIVSCFGGFYSACLYFTFMVAQGILEDNINEDVIIWFFSLSGAFFSFRCF